MGERCKIDVMVTVILRIRLLRADPLSGATLVYSSIAKVLGHQLALTHILALICHLLTPRCGLGLVGVPVHLQLTSSWGLLYPECLLNQLQKSTTNVVDREVNQT